MKTHYAVGVFSLIALILGVSLPLVTTESFWLWRSDASIVGSAAHLWTSGDYLLAGCIGLFSVVLPFVKWWFAVTRPLPHTASRWLVLAKWSMLDVFIVVGIAGMVQFGVAGTARIGPALLPFVAGLLGTTWLAMPKSDSVTAALTPQRSLAGIGLIGVLLFAPLLTVEKHWILSSQLSIRAAIGALAAQGAWITLVVFAVSAIIVPLYASMDGLLGPLPGGAAARRWQMIDVFALSMAILATKLVISGDAELHWGLLIAIAAGIVYGAPLRSGRQRAAASH